MSLNFNDPSIDFAALAKRLAHDIKKPFSLMSMGLDMLSYTSEGEDIGPIVSQVRSDTLAASQRVDLNVRNLVTLAETGEQALEGKASLRAAFAEACKRLSSEEIRDPRGENLDWGHEQMIAGSQDHLAQLLTNILFLYPGPGLNITSSEDDDNGRITVEFAMSHEGSWAEDIGEFSWDQLAWRAAKVLANRMGAGLSRSKDGCQLILVAAPWTSDRG